MKRAISTTNPYGHDRYGFLWEVLSAEPGGRHLDYGAYDGEVLSTLARTGVIAEGMGVDANHEVVERHASAMPPNTRLLPIVPGSPLPFQDQSFDSISLLDVLEHVADQGRLLVELRRVLRDGGVLVVTVPRRYALSFLDTGNWKFAFPKLHRLAYTVARGRESYQRRYVDCENGLFGDIEVGKGCHEHFGAAGLGALLKDHGLTLEQVDGAAFFDRVTVLARPVLPARVRRWLDRMDRWDAVRFSAAHLFVTGRR